MDGTLETAYIQIIDCRKLDTKNVNPDAAKKALSKNSKDKNVQTSSVINLKVQFNPSELTFSSGEAAYGNDKASVHYDNGKEPITLSNNPSTSISVGIKLVFDKSIYKNSSVQSEVEGFFALIKNPYVRQIAFYWGTMCYVGVVKRLDAEYVMFDENGNPIRANVNMSIIVNEEYKLKEEKGILG